MGRRVKINGARGRWVAEVEGRWLGVLHHTFRVPPDRYEAAILPKHVGGRRLAELEAALRGTDLVVVQRDKSPADLARDGHIGVFRFKDLVFDPAIGLRLTFIE